MRKIKVIGTKREEGFSLAFIHIAQKGTVLDDTHPFDTKDFGTNPLLTIQYKRLRFQIPNGAGVLYTDGIVPVLSQTGNGFLYNNITGF